MFENFKDLLILSKLEHDYSRIAARAAKSKRRFRQTDDYKKMDAAERHFHDTEPDIDEIELIEQIEGIRTRRALRLARKYNIPIPDSSTSIIRTGCSEPYWTESPYGKYHLTRTGHHKLINEIRLEKKARREDVFLWWMPIISTITGLLGLVITLITILTH